MQSENCLLTIESQYDQNEAIQCEIGNKASYVCYDKVCQIYAFVCENNSCQCRTKHKDCIRLEIEQVQKAIYKKILSIQPFVNKIDEMIQKSIDQLSVLRQLTINQLRQKYEFALLTESEKDFVQFLKNRTHKDINCSLMYNINKTFIEEPPQDIKIEDLTLKFGKLWEHFHNQITQVKRKITHSFKLGKNQFFYKQENLVVDQNGWIRIMMKKDNVITTDFKGTLTEEDIPKMKITDIGWSDNPETMNTPESWYINNVNFQTNFQTNINFPISKLVANVFNGKTPTGEEWTEQYQAAYLKYHGIVRTYGYFKSFYMGKAWKEHISIGSQTLLRSGGHPSHTGEWIHSKCNGYSEKEHSITSRFGWKNTRVFWVRTA